jgi:hypothetical protein
MFYPDKAAGVRETARVLKPGGQFLFNVWDSVEKNPIILQLGLDVLPPFFGREPSRFLSVPFGYNAIDPTKDMLHEAGFNRLDIHVIPTISERPSARHVAQGLICGNPSILDLQERGNAPVEEVVDAATVAIKSAFGDNPVRVPLQAIVFSTYL